MGFSHVQGVEGRDSAGNGTATSLTVTLGSNPTKGNLVVVGCMIVPPSGTVSGLSVKDSNSNVYTFTPNSVLAPASGNLIIAIAYLASAPTNATKTINFTWTGGAFGGAEVDEFSPGGGLVFLDKDVVSTSGVCSGTTANTPSITPRATGELLYGFAAPAVNFTAPTAGGSLGGWTGSGGGPDSSYGFDAEYILSSSSGSTSADYTDSTSGDSYSAIIATFTIAGLGLSGDEDQKPQALGFYYDDDTYGPNVTGWPGIGTLLAVPKTFEMDCDITSRNFDVNTAFMREPEGELPTLAWSHGVNAYVVPPPLLCDPDCDATSRNLDQFLAEMQVLDDLDKPPQNFAPVIMPTMDWAALEDDQQANPDAFCHSERSEESAFFSWPFSPAMDWTADYDWHKWWDARVVEGEDERELAWPIPAAQAFNAQIDCTADYDWQQSRDMRVVEDEDPAPTLQNFFPPADWTADYDWHKWWDARVVEDEDEREIPWPIPTGAPLLKLGWDQDSIESRWCDPSDLVCHSERSEEFALPVRPFSPTLAWDDWDWSHSVDTRVIVQDDMDSRSLQAIALQVFAMAIQQMLAVPMLGLRAMTLDQDDLGLQQMLNVMMLGVESIDNEV